MIRSCNSTSGAIKAWRTGVENNIYTSQLNVTLNVDIFGRSIECFHDNGRGNETKLGSSLITGIQKLKSSNILNFVFMFMLTLIIPQSQTQSVFEQQFPESAHFQLVWECNFTQLSWCLLQHSNSELWQLPHYHQTHICHLYWGSNQWGVYSIHVDCCLWKCHWQCD